MEPAVEPRRLHGRRDLILECFVRHVAERGYDGTNLSDIANELAISKGTIVHHFTSKDRMLAEAHERGWFGEVEGLQTSLAAAEQKLVQMRRTAVNLGLPTLPARTPRRTR